MAKFIVQQHHATRMHYDFRLEIDGVLKSWAVPKGPSMDPEEKRLAIMVSDHAIAWGDFEGRIPEGRYGAGNVIVWDNGSFELEWDVKYSFEKGHLALDLHGHKLKGGFDLIKLKDKKTIWLLVKRKDKYATKKDILKNKKSELLKGAKKSKMPQDLKPMMTVLVDKPFNNPEWLFEVKWDGYRILAELKKYKVDLYTRNRLLYNDKFYWLVKALKLIRHDAILDGEVVILDDKGRPSFQLMQNLQKDKKGQLVYYIFDILYLDGYDLRELPLEQRKRILASIIQDPILYQNRILRLSDYLLEKGVDFYKAAQKQNLEGIIAKNIKSPYRSGRRSADWLKTKTQMRQEAVIGGFTEPRGGRKYFGALVLGVYKNDKFRYIGHTGGGFDDQMLSDIYWKLNRLKKNQPPFEEPPKTNAPVKWVKPKLIAEIKFSEWTDDGIMRQPIFLGLREDKHPKEVKIEKPIEAKPLYKNEMEITHPDKIYWPKEKFTKGDLIEYYTKISLVMFPYLKGRPHNLYRQPNGIKGEGFYQKNIDFNLPKGIETVSIYSESDDKDINYLVANNKNTLIYMAQLGCIEINPWNSRVQSIENPDYCIIDLDPNKIGFEKVIETAQAVYEVLKEAEIPSYPKTSGADGLHILIPLKTKYTYEQSKQFAQLIANIVCRRLPYITSIKRSPKTRTKKVYIDYLQNRKGQTITAPYSVRPREGIPVSTPLEWKEVKTGLSPLDFTVFNIFKRLKKKGDIFKGVLGKGIDMKKALDRLSNL